MGQGNQPCNVKWLCMSDSQQCTLMGQDNHVM